MKKYLQLMRLHRPVGILLLLWPTLWALWLANHGLPSFKLLFIFITGTILTRSAGCVINDICDRQFDRHVERTRTRPLATGVISLTQAVILLLVLASLALLLVLQLNITTIILSVVAAMIAAIYPLMKRMTYFPQVVLGIAFSMGIPMAYTASANEFPTTGWILFLTAILWPIMYDTAYALADYSDDVKIGVKSTAVFFGQRSARFIVLLQILFIAGLICIAVLAKLNVTFYVAILLSSLLFIYQQTLLKQNKPFAAFLNNQWVGLLIWLGIVFNDIF